MRTIPYSSRDPFYKSVFGSTEEGEKFTLKVLLKRDGYVKGAVAVFDKDGEEEQRFELLDDLNNLEENFYTRSVTLSLKEGLYFYKFIMYTVDGERELLNIGGGIGEFAPCNGKPWQHTVYEKNFSTPENIKGGIIYQIFPDRFSKGKVSSKIPKDRYLRNDWGGIPLYNQSEDENQLQIGKDFFGGNLNGITEKLDYISSLGVNVIYLNPIFEAQSNHRYDTSDYMKIDPVLGDEKDFVNLCKKAKKKGINIILDGVFSHTGNDSVYFNSKNRYKSIGAYNSKSSPYFSWYKFKKYPNDYHSWWGVKTLPEVFEDDPSFTEFITGENGVIGYWMDKGASGFRLDVADELPDAFLDNVRKAVKRANSDGFLLGEVWEDATNKVSYNQRRRFLRGKQLDSVMNYPFKDAIINFVKFGNGGTFAERILEICENYPKPALHTLMNHIGTHDTARIITNLSVCRAVGDDRNSKAEFKMTEEEYNLGVNRLMQAAVLQYTLPGIPSLYYGDEAGLTGFGDPFCRGCFPWKNPDKKLTEFYKKLGKIRRNCKVFTNGDIFFYNAEEKLVFYRRKNEFGTAFAGVNLDSKDVRVKPKESLDNVKAFFGEILSTGEILIPAKGFALIC